MLRGVRSLRFLSIEVAVQQSSIRSCFIRLGSHVGWLYTWGIALRAELRGAQVRPVAYVALSGDLPGFLPITELGAWILVSPIEEWAAVWERGGEGKRLSMSSP